MDVSIFTKLEKNEQLIYFQKMGIEPNKYFNSKYTNRGLSNEEMLNRDYYKGRFATVLSSKNGIPERVILNYDEIPIK